MKLTALLLLSFVLLASGKEIQVKSQNETGQITDKAATKQHLAEEPEPEPEAHWEGSGDAQTRITSGPETVAAAKSAEEEEVPFAAFGGEVIPYIIGGTPAGEGMFPHQVSLRDSQHKHFCGGSIISHQWILTAAHCVKGDTPGSLTVTVGTNKLNHGGHTFHVSKIIPHPDFNEQDKHSDIALLHLSGSLTYGPTIQPIELARVATKSGTTCALSGWGSTSRTKTTPPNDLQQIALKTISYSTCKSKLKEEGITKNMLCTFVGPNHGFCKGDSGGPLIAAGKQIGVVSFYVNCGKAKPDVFTDVASFRAWIKSHSGV